MRAGKQNPTVMVGDRDGFGNAEDTQLRYLIYAMTNRCDLPYACRALYDLDDDLDALRINTHEALMLYARR